MGDKAMTNLLPAAFLKIRSDAAVVVVMAGDAIAVNRPYRRRHQAVSSRGGPGAKILNLGFRRGSSIIICCVHHQWRNSRRMRKEGLMADCCNSASIELSGMYMKSKKEIMKKNNIMSKERKGRQNVCLICGRRRRCEPAPNKEGNGRRLSE